MVMKKIQIICAALVFSTAALLNASVCMAQSKSELLVMLDGLSHRVAELEKRIKRMKMRRELVGEIIEGVNFKVNSVSLSPESKRLIDELVRKIPDIRNTYFYVAGYTDSRGSAEYNYQLGMRRASNVARYLIESEHIDPSHVATGSHGKADPFAMDNNQLSANLNRHVEIIAYRWVIH